MLTFIIVFLGLSALILGHEAAHFFVAKNFDLKVEEFGFGFPPRLKAWRRGGTEYSLNWLPFGGFVKIAGEEGEMGMVSLPADRASYFFAAAAWRRAMVIAAGVIANLLLGWLLISAVFMAGTPHILAVGAVLSGSPAAAAGIAPGDVLKSFRSADQFTAFIESHPQGASFTVLRNGKELPFTIAPRAANGIPRIGVELTDGGAAGMAPGPALAAGLAASGRICLLTLQAFYELGKNLLLHGSLLPGVVGPVGIFSVAGETSQLGLAYLFELLGIISLNLAVANLIPFPALDGGRLLLILIEKIKGSPVPKRVEGILNGLGFAFLILLMVLVTVRDIGNWLH